MELVTSEDFESTAGTLRGQASAFGGMLFSEGWTWSTASERVLACRILGGWAAIYISGSAEEAPVLDSTRAAWRSMVNQFKSQVFSPSARSLAWNRAGLRTDEPLRAFEEIVDPTPAELSTLATLVKDNEHRR